MPVPISCDSCLETCIREHNCHGYAGCKINLRNTHVVRNGSNTCAVSQQSLSTDRDRVHTVPQVNWMQCRQTSTGNSFQ